MTDANTTGQALRSALERVTRDVMLEVQANVIEVTPVDTSWARANWIPNVGSPAPSIGTPKDREARVSAVGAAQAAQQAGGAKLIAYRLADGVAFLSNSVPYIEKLNGGSSTQRAANFVQIAIRKGINTVSRRLTS